MKAEGKGSGAWNVRSEFKWRCEGGVSKVGACPVGSSDRPDLPRS